MSKPILDAMQAIVYDDDRQIVQAEITPTRMGAAYQVVGVRPLIVTALQTGNQFVSVRVEDPGNWAPWKSRPGRSPPRGKAIPGPAANSNRGPSKSP